MTPDKIIVTVAGVLGIGFVYWFFLAKKQTRLNVSGSVAISVEGGYVPEVITIPEGRSTTLTFTRTDANTCLEEVVLGDFGIRKFLPLNEAVSVELHPRQKGEFSYTCGMNMYHGKIIVT